MKKKKKKAQKTRAASKGVLETADTKVMRLAHEVLTKTIWPADLTLEEAVDVAAFVVKAIVLSNTKDDDVEERADMIEWAEGRFLSVLDDANPLMQAEPMHVWLVSPQGSITEPVGFIWGGQEGDDVQVVLGSDLEELRAEIRDGAEDAIVTEGVEGLAVLDPEWDGKPTMSCSNPECRATHDVHLLVAENLFHNVRRQSSTN